MSDGWHCQVVSDNAYGLDGKPDLKIQRKNTGSPVNIFDDASSGSPQYLLQNQQIILYSPKIILLRFGVRDSRSFARRSEVCRNIHLILKRKPRDAARRTPNLKTYDIVGRTTDGGAPL
jgi:hypothetical protein